MVPDSEGYGVNFKQLQDWQLVVTVENDEKNISIEEIIKAIK